MAKYFWSIYTTLNLQHLSLCNVIETEIGDTFRGIVYSMFQWAIYGPLLYKLEFNISITYFIYLRVILLIVLSHLGFKRAYAFYVSIMSIYNNEHGLWQWYRFVLLWFLFEPNLTNMPLPVISYLAQRFIWVWFEWFHRIQGCTRTIATAIMGNFDRCPSKTICLSEMTWSCCQN